MRSDEAQPFIRDLDAFNDLAAIEAKRTIDANPRLIFSLSNNALFDLKAKGLRIGFMSGVNDYSLAKIATEELERRGFQTSGRRVGS